MKGIMQTLRIRNLILITSLTCHSPMLIEKDLMLSIVQFPSSPPPTLCTQGYPSLGHRISSTIIKVAQMNGCCWWKKKNKSENPRASWACKTQLRPDKPSDKRHFLTNTKLVIFFTKAYSTLLKKKKTNLQGCYQPYIWWSSSVLTGWCLRALKKSFLYADRIICLTIHRNACEKLHHTQFPW